MVLLVKMRKTLSFLGSLICLLTFTSIPFSNLGSGSDFISQQLYTGFSVATLAEVGASSLTTAEAFAAPEKIIQITSSYGPAGQGP